MTRRVVTEQQVESFETDGFFRIEGFAPPEIGRAMFDRVLDIARRQGWFRP